jgi:hypothetical protein
MKQILTILGATAWLFSPALSQAELVKFYVGLDRAATLTSGTYKNLPNPNYQRLTFLYAHAYLETPMSDHYHNIGSYTYTGPSNAPVAVPTNSNYRIPEISTGNQPLTLVEETNGLFAGKLVNKSTTEDYSDPRIRSVHQILPYITATVTNQFGFGSAEFVMFHSKSDGWTNSLEGSVIAMELVEKSEGLHVGTTNQLDALVNVGDRVTMGDGNTFDFTPVVWTEANATPGAYTFKFRLVDASGSAAPMLDSGIVTFLYRVQAAPQLSIAQTVTLTMPTITEGYVLEEAASPAGPWITVAETPVVETISGGHSAAQTGNKTLTQSANAAAHFYRLRKL